MGTEREPTSSTPLWVKVFGVIVLIAVLLFLVLMLSGNGGRRGPGRHLSSAGPDGRTLSSSVPEDHPRPGGGPG